MLPAEDPGTFVSPGGSWSEAPSPSLPCVGIAVFHSFGQAEAEWRKAQDHCDCYGFQTFDWLSTWHETIGIVERIVPQIVRVADADGSTLMLLPLGIQRRLGLSHLVFLGGGTTDYNAPIIRADFAASLDPDAADALIARILKQLPDVDVVALDRMPVVIDGVANALAHLRGAEHVSNAWVATLGETFADFKKRRSAKFFKKAAGMQRRLAEMGATELCLADTPEAVADIMQAFVRQKRRRLQEIGSPDLFARPGHLRFYKAMAERHRDTGFIQLSALRVGETIVATHWGMVFRNRIYWLMPTYETGEWARLSVGRLLMQRLVEWGIARRIKYFDLTIGDEEYKRLWADHTMPLHACVRGVTVRGKVYQAIRLTVGHLKALVARSERLRSIARGLAPPRGFRRPAAE
ncbi:GNAT family N-acetyltransferase [Bradyrhizobium sp. 157]|uniref:GNAT family N-acetyltransferase n=1 Tax=Bradyrhizobium sp. 157 TaxID=2782631 RepID=UPI001FFA7E91|nr:GNAT family N-acetyltransferase [Bradyrhizobium sp. 157]MCK1640537.1 GNAT family N-acetyltransferase [Bradyrhizobium sp. 157]